MSDVIWRRLATEYQHLPFYVDVWADILTSLNAYTAPQGVWCDENCDRPWDWELIPYYGGRAEGVRVRFFFEDCNDALMFKLRWV